MKFRLERTMPLGCPVVPPENRMAAGSSAVVEIGGVVEGGLPSVFMRSAHQRTRGSGGTFAIFRPRVSQKPSLLRGGR